MKSYIIAALIAILAITAVQATVHNLDESNFQSFIESQDYTLVKFYAPWCGHCKSLAPEYEKAADLLEGKHKLAHVDCTQDDAKALCEKHGVRGYPTLKFFTKDGQSTDYDEARTADGIVNFIVANTSPAFTIVKDAKELEEFLAGPQELKLVVNAAEDSAAAKSVIEKSAVLRKSAAIAINTVNTDNTAVLHRKFDEPIVNFDGAEITGDAIEKFIKNNSLPLIGEIGPQNYRKYVETNLPLAWIFLDQDDEAQVKAVESLKPIVKQYNDKFVAAKLDGKRWEQHAKSFGLTKVAPGIALEDRNGRKKFVHEPETLTADGFKKFIEDFVAGKLEPVLRSEPLPESNDGPLTILVGKNFDEIVNNKDKDVFVKFYAPWCGHCKRMIPDYEALADNFANDENIVIAKFDATANDHSGPEVTGFPTIFLFPAGDKTEPIRYNGERNTKAMEEFITANRKSVARAAAATDGKDEL